MMNLIWNEDEVDFFMRKVLEFPYQDEVYFLYLSARNKYLSGEERKLYHLGRTEMFSRLIVRNTTHWESSFRQLAYNAAAYRTENGSELPEKAIVCYMNINPSSVLKAYNSFCDEMNRYIMDYTISLMRGKESDISSLRRLDKVLLTHVQNSTSRRIWLDIDFDTKDESILNSFLKEMKDKVQHVVISTKSGFHVLIHRESLNQLVSSDKKRLFEQTLRECHQLATKTGGEVVINKNAMIPVPGAYQGGHQVSMIRRNFLGIK